MHWLMIYTRRVALLFLLALAMIGYLHYRAFRTLQGMIVPLVTAIMGVIWALGLMGLIGAPMDPWNIMTPILLLAIGAGHSVQILKRYYEEYARARATRPDVPGTEHNRHRGHRGDGQGRRRHAGGGDDRVAQLRVAGGVRAADDQELRPVHGVRHRRGADRRDDVHPGDPGADVAAVAASRPSARSARSTSIRSWKSWRDTVRAGKERPILWVFVGGHRAGAGRAGAPKAGNTLGAQFFEGNAPVHGFRMADARLAGTRVIQVLVEGDAPDTIKNPDVLRRMDELGSFIAHQPLPVGKVVSIVDLLRQMSLVMDRAAAASCPTRPRASRSTCCSTRWAARTKTSRTSSITTSSAR